jgi:hypothetical protein
MPRQDLIYMKLNRVIGPMIADLKRNKKVVHRVGGATVKTMGEEIKLQVSRQQNLEWASTVTDTEIQIKVVELEASLSKDELACKYGNVRGLSLEKVEVIAKIEDLEIALGTHPGVAD